MNQRPQAIALGLVALAAASACGPPARTKRPLAPPVSVGSVVTGRLPTAIATMPLTEANGTRTDLAAFRGKAVMVADFMTQCTDICPLISANTVALAHALSRAGLSRRTALLEITIDPHRDIPARLRAYQHLYGARPANWYLLRADPVDTARLWKYFGVYVHRVKEGNPPDRDWLTGEPLSYDIAHSDDLVFLAPNGQERFVVDGNPDTDGSPLPKRLRLDLSAQGRRDLSHPHPAEDWTTAQAVRVFTDPRSLAPVARARRLVFGDQKTRDVSRRFTRLPLGELVRVTVNTGNTPTT